MQMFDPDLLRTFVAFADSGSLARAAAIVGRSPSAVTAQMQRLEAAVGDPLLSRDGRGRDLTPAGEDLLIHARRILDVHRDAWLSLNGARAEGRIALGATQDFADTGLPELLRDYVRTHARVRLDLRIGRSSELSEAFEGGGLDIAIAMGAADGAGAAVIAEPMAWLAAKSGLVCAGDELPLALLDPPCGFRTAALAALDAAGRTYRLAATSQTLAGVRAAVRSGFAVTLRTRRMSGGDIVEAPPSLGLPLVTQAKFTIRLSRTPAPAASALYALLCDGLGARP